jgi:dye decolorizing peroxidase
VSTASNASGDRPRLSRRGLLTGGALAAGGVLAGGAVVAGTTAGRDGDRPDITPAAEHFGLSIEPFHGPRQAGVATPPQAYASFVALTLLPDVDRDALGRMLRLLTDDAVRLTRGEPALADTEAELAVLPARLTITFGFGPEVYRAAGRMERKPASLAELPPFGIDRLEPAWSGGDLLLQICADDAITVAHAQRVLVKDIRPFARVRWVQQGFRRGRGVEPDGFTQRNLFGQLDGTVNPDPATPAGEAAIWSAADEPWLKDSSTLVIRRIRLDMEGWDLLGRVERELTVGRRLTDGAPLTGRDEHDAPDFDATDDVGLPIIPAFSHVRRAHVADERLRILRRSYNYDGAPADNGDADSGMIFCAYQADIERQFLPIQQRLAEQDVLNEWTIPIGSAVFAIPPGCAPGGWIGQQVLE